MNWFESFWIRLELELNWIEKSPGKILNPTWIGNELNWKKWIDPSPGPYQVFITDRLANIRIRNLVRCMAVYLCQKRDIYAAA